jgi:hypothetical protein
MEAVMTAVYLIKRSPTRSNKDDKLPTEKWFGRKPNLSNLRVFGSIAYLHVPKEQLHGKFESHSLKCIMFGYCNNGYRLWLLEKARVVSGRTVIFYENSKEHKKERSMEQNEQESFQQYENEESFLELHQENTMRN